MGAVVSFATDDGQDGLANRRCLWAFGVTAAHGGAASRFLADGICLDREAIDPRLLAVAAGRPFCQAACRKHLQSL